MDLAIAPTLEQTVRVRHRAGHSQRAIAETSTSTAVRSSASSTKRLETTQRTQGQSQNGLALLLEWPGIVDAQRL